MHQTFPTSQQVQATIYVDADFAGETSDQQAQTRGLINGMLISLVMWLGAGYLTFRAVSG